MKTTLFSSGYQIPEVIVFKKQAHIAEWRYHNGDIVKHLEKNSVYPEDRVLLGWVRHEVW